jgi:hypothetical protein
MSKFRNLIILIWFLGSGCSVNIPYLVQEKLTGHLGELVGERKVGQVFYSQMKEIASIGILMANYLNRKNTEDILFQVGILPEGEFSEIEKKAPLRQVIVNASQIQDNAWHFFSFPPIKNCQGKTFYFYLSSPTSYPGNAVTIYYSKDDVLEQGFAFIGGEKLKGDLCFQVKTPIKGSQIIMNFGSRFFGDIKFSIFYLLIILTLIILIFGKSLAEKRTK